MNHALAVGVVQRPGHFGDDVQRPRRRNGVVTQRFSASVPAMYSMAIHGRPSSVSPRLNTVTMFGWSRAAVVTASCRKASRAAALSARVDGEHFEGFSS